MSIGSTRLNNIGTRPTKLEALHPNQCHPNVCDVDPKTNLYEKETAYLPFEQPDLFHVKPPRDLEVEALSERKSSAVRPEA